MWTQQFYPIMAPKKTSQRRYSKRKSYHIFAKFYSVWIFSWASHIDDNQLMHMHAAMGRHHPTICRLYSDSKSHYNALDDVNRLKFTGQPHSDRQSGQVALGLCKLASSVTFATECLEQIFARNVPRGSVTMRDDTRHVFTAAPLKRPR